MIDLDLSKEAMLEECDLLIAEGVKTIELGDPLW